MKVKWWAAQGSNLRPPACKAGDVNSEKPVNIGSNTTDPENATCFATPDAEIVVRNGILNLLNGLPKEELVHLLVEIIKAK